MQDQYIYDYALIRVVPKVEREEFLNAGVIVSCPEKEFLEACIELDEQRLKVFNPTIDIETTKTHLAAIISICAGTDIGAIGKLSQRERFLWLTSPRSTIIQTSAIHSGLCKDPKEILDHLVETMVKTQIKD